MLELLFFLICICSLSSRESIVPRYSSSVSILNTLSWVAKALLLVKLDVFCFEELLSDWLWSSTSMISSSWPVSFIFWFNFLLCFIRPGLFFEFPNRTSIASKSECLLSFASSWAKAESLMASYYRSIPQLWRPSIWTNWFASPTLKSYRILFSYSRIYYDLKLVKSRTRYYGWMQRSSATLITSLSWIGFFFVSTVKSTFPSIMMYKTSFYCPNSSMVSPA